MIHIAICDDIQSDRQNIINLVNNYFVNTDIEFIISAFEKGGDLIDHCYNKPIDIVFLDIYLIGEFGIDIAKELRKVASNCKLIFTTLSSEHALECFEVFAFNYLLKPINEEKFNSIFSMAIDVIEKEKQNRICIKNGDSYTTIMHNEILYIESNDKKIFIYTMQNTVLACYAKLDKIESDLNSNRFIRCHKSYIVNMDYVEKVSSNLFFLKKNHVVSIKQKNYTAIRKKYIEYISNKLNLDESR